MLTLKDSSKEARPIPTHLRLLLCALRRNFVYGLISYYTPQVKVNHAFIGWQNAFNVLGEIKGRNPVRTVRKASMISLSMVSIMFFFINVAYVAVVPREELRNSGQLIAALFFRRVFGPGLGVKVIPLLVACSCFGNIVGFAIYYHTIC